MITFNPNPGRDLVLTHSPILRAYLAVAQYISEHDAIGLTKSGAWNRLFIEWAVAEINFPGWTADDLYAVNKVLNEYDVAPLEFLHALMDGLKWGRKYKSTYPFDAPDEGRADLQDDWQPAGRAAFTRPRQDGQHGTLPRDRA